MDRDKKNSKHPQALILILGGRNPPDRNFNNQQASGKRRNRFAYISAQRKKKVSAVGKSVMISLTDVKPRSS